MLLLAGIDTGEGGGGLGIPPPPQKKKKNYYRKCPVFPPKPTYDYNKKKIQFVSFFLFWLSYEIFLPRKSLIGCINHGAFIGGASPASEATLSSCQLRFAVCRWVGLVRASVGVNGHRVCTSAIFALKTAGKYKVSSG